MRYKQDNRKSNDIVSNSNTPHLREKTIILGMAYFFSGANCVIGGILSAKGIGRQIDILFGIILLLMVPISVTDERRENRGSLAVVGTCILHMVFCILLSFTSSPWWMVVYICEVLLCTGIVIALMKLSDNHC